jgi:O-antigen ligase
VKVTILYAACLVWTRLLRDQATGKAVASSLIICSCLLCALIVVVYVTHLGWVLPTYKATRGLKGLTEEDIPLNAVPFAAILAYFTAMCLLRTTKRLLFLGVLVLAISTLFTGSRTPLAIVGASAFILGLILAIRSNKLLYKVGGWICLVVCTILLIIAIHNTPIKEINKLSEGRIDLWSVAWDKFLERPIFGNGFDSWDDDLVSRLPGEYRMASLVAKNLAGGGYHNEYLTMLAEQGIVGTIPALYFFGFFFATCWKLSFRQSATWHHGNWALFGCLVILLRASVEIPGLFGYGGQEPADYLCFLFVALAVSRLSIEEDYLRAEALAVPPPEPPSVTGRLTGFRASDKGIAHLS